ncbi:hypothetical protein PsYK624_015310 [Phanerochaete sordida]|uniref:Uncharacterized protein n=1 Tax=Phanerochaete sordida TaxID=48140 RepID=A0A9P3L981_9APHY|nr:hypothetical protein PsYK624_015310 [Phanerochaete sordida]
MARFQYVPCGRTASAAAPGSELSDLSAVLVARRRRRRGAGDASGNQASRLWRAASSGGHPFNESALSIAALHSTPQEMLKKKLT